MEDDKKPNEAKTKKSESNKSESKKTPKDFTTEIKGEFKKIIWPNRKELITKTGTVIVTSLIIGVIIFGMDTVFAYAYAGIVSLLG